MTTMTTTAAPPVTTAEDKAKVPVTASAPAVPSKAPEAKTLEAKTLEAKAPEVKAPEVKAPEAKAPEAKAPEALTFNKEKYEQYPIVRMYLKQAGCIQYDPANPDLVLNTTDEKGMLLPLTPFFKSRIGTTLEIVL